MSLSAGDGNHAMQTSVWCYANQLNFVPHPLGYTDSDVSAFLMIESNRFSRFGCLIPQA